MLSSRLVRGLVALALLAPALPAFAQDMPPMPKPGPEHQILKEDEGTWAATVEVFMPGAPAMTSKGMETNRIGCGGLCLISDFKSDMMGMPFEGHGTTVYDPAKKKYVGSWSDSMSAGMMLGESTYDAATKTVTGWMEGPDMTGKVTRSKSVVEYKDGTRVMSMYTTGPDGKEGLTMRITYARQK
jgi:Protein of unknown function (DUF1579)